MGIPRSIHIKSFGPIVEADVEFGDLTVIVGPQAAGKSLFLQLMKLLVDRTSIVRELKKHNIRWSNQEEFFRIYFGEGLAGLWTNQTEVFLDGRQVFPSRLQSTKGKPGEPKVFYLPAQRVMALRDGLTHPFSDFRAGDPYVVRSFSDNIHRLVQTEFTGRERLFPTEGRMNQAIREALAQALFGPFELLLDRTEAQQRFVLKGLGASLPFMNWSAGQREFTPLLLGLLWLMPAGGAQRRDTLQHVVIEEPEMGLHPKAISAFLLVVLELLRRGYRVCLSTHSPHVLDVIWAIGLFRKHQAGSKDVRRMFEVKGSPFIESVAKAALGKTYRTYYFPIGERAVDISSLDLGDDEASVRGWGGLTAFTENIGDVVADVVSRRQRR
jgi:energy-coupling factor transporter ATP-binding protein EcfA2